MNMLLAEASAYGQTLADYLKAEPFPGQVFLVPPFTALHTLCQVVSDANVLVGAQDTHWEDFGAYTGEVSCPMIADCGARLVEMGHSERRHHFSESDETVNLKAKAAIRHGLRPLICIGENADQREGGAASAVIERQVRGALADVSPVDAANVIFAYEPVWAIGDGSKPASAEIANEISAFVHQLLIQDFGAEIGSAIPVLYGGSVNAENAVAYLEQNDIDGLFIGRAAWKVEGLIEILRLSRAVLTDRQNVV